MGDADENEAIYRSKLFYTFNPAAVHFGACAKPSVIPESLGG